MKKLLTIFLMIIYITTTSGIALSIHYCMGDISSVVIGQNNSTTCPTCGMENEGCCHNDFKVVKLTDSHQASFLVNELQKPIITTPEPVVAYYASFPEQERYIVQQNHSPPPAHSLNILYCVFRI
jgi:hypothetical protein